MNIHRKTRKFLLHVPEKYAILWVIQRCEVIMFKKIRNFTSSCCVLFTLLVFLLFAIGKLFSEFEVALNLPKTAMLFGTCALLCLCSGILFVKKIPFGIRILMHYFLVLGAMYLVFAVIGKFISSSLQSLVMLAFVTLIYSIIALVYAFLRTKLDTKESTQYKSMFKK